MSGDILLISNYSGGYYFSGPLRGMHGGLHPEDSFATLAFGFARCDEIGMAGCPADLAKIDSKTLSE